MNTRYFRAGVGTVIYNALGEIAIFKRAQPPVGIWQFQQGGIDAGESHDLTLWRELKEEVGLNKEDISSIMEMPGWHAYQDLNTYTDHAILRVGQVHKWYFLELKDSSSINLDHATDAEFSDWKYTTFSEAIAKTSAHKRFIYEQLERFYIDYVKNKTPHI